MKYDDIFVPNEQPTYTYVERKSLRLENILRDAISTRNIVISISGPSKTGKTVLFRNVVQEDYIIPLSGSSIKTEFDFWSTIFAWIGEPIKIVKTAGHSVGGNVQLEGSASTDFLVASAKLKGAAGISGAATSEKEVTEPFNPFWKLVKEIGKSDFVLFVDDFHYIPKELQPSLAKIFKGLAENGVKICTASVPHKSDDVVRANPELRGRLISIDVESWSNNELEIIAKKGFRLLNIDFDMSFIQKLSSEAFGSPQLMQALCLNLCRNIDVREKLPQPSHIQINQETFDRTKEDTANFANFRSLLLALHSGPKKHGKDRKIVNFSDGSRGDAYRAALLALASGEPKRDFTYDEIMSRVKAVCIDEAPANLSIQRALQHMHSICNDVSTSAVLDWDEDILNIVDPYFAFYLRSSKQLQKIQRVDQ